MLAQAPLFGGGAVKNVAFVVDKKAYDQLIRQLKTLEDEGLAFKVAEGESKNE